MQLYYVHSPVKKKIKKIEFNKKSFDHFIIYIFNYLLLYAFNPSLAMHHPPGIQSEEEFMQSFYTLSITNHILEKKQQNLTLNEILVLCLTK